MRCKGFDCLNKHLCWYQFTDSCQLEYANTKHKQLSYTKNFLLIFKHFNLTNKFVLDWFTLFRDYTSFYLKMLVYKIWYLFIIFNSITTKHSYNFTHAMLSHSDWGKIYNIVHIHQSKYFAIYVYENPNHNVSNNSNKLMILLRRLSIAFHSHAFHSDGKLNATQ